MDQHRKPPKQFDFVGDSAFDDDDRDDRVIRCYFCGREMAAPRRTEFHAGHGIFRWVNECVSCCRKNMKERREPGCLAGAIELASLGIFVLLCSAAMIGAIFVFFSLIR